MAVLSLASHTFIVSFSFHGSQKNEVPGDVFSVCVQPGAQHVGIVCELALADSPAGVFFFGVYSWLVKVLGQFSIIYSRGLGLRIGVWVWVRVGVRVWVRVRVRVRVRVSVVLWSG